MSDDNVYAVTMAAFWRIADRWRLTTRECAMLLAVHKTCVNRWKTRVKPPHLWPDQFARISYVLGVYSGLQAVLGDTPFADEWIRRPNSDFDDRAPLDRMLTGNLADLAAVRDYVDRWVTC